MLYVKVVLNLPVEGPFDYLVPEEIEKDVRAGSRVWINFRGKKEVGFIVGTSPRTAIAAVKPIIKLIDDIPVLGPLMLEFSRMLSEYYCCSLGEAISVSLPEPLRRGRPVENPVLPSVPREGGKYEGIVICDLDGQARWKIYAREIERTVSQGLSAIVLFPDKDLCEKARAVLQGMLSPKIAEFLLRQPDEVEEWQASRQGRSKLVIGTRSAIFAPLPDLGLIIIDEENDEAYKQDQSPHYHARELALIRSRLQKARIILCSGAVSLEAMQLVKKDKFAFQIIDREQERPQVNLIDMKNLPLLDRKKNIILSRLLQDSMVGCLSEKGKILLFLNRRGFATQAICSTCARTLKCPRCNTNLVYFYEQNKLRCHYCNYSIVPPKLCPYCNSGYIKFSGAGTEKIESELSRIFPQAGIKRLEGGQVPLRDEADIFIATQGVIRRSDFRFELVAALGIDNILNHVDFRASEKAFGLLAGLLAITAKKLFVQTSLPGHYCFRAVRENDIRIFYDQELKSRRQVKFPPFRHFCQVRIRGKDERRSRDSAEKLFQKLSAAPKPKGLEVVSLNPGQPPKLRANFYWVILVSCANVPVMSGFLKNNLKDFRQSGIIVTVDVDPV